MSEAKFTSGPWSVWNQFTVVIGDDVNSRVSAQNTGGVDSSVIEREANASLIATAPEMYRELKELSGIINRMGASSASDRIERLLSKARGEL